MCIWLFKIYVCNFELQKSILLTIVVINFTTFSNLIIKLHKLTIITALIRCYFLKHSSLFHFLSFHRFFFVFRCCRSRCCPLSRIIDPMFLFISYIIINPLSFRGIASPLLRVINPIVCFSLNVVINLFSHWIVAIL